MLVWAIIILNKMNIAEQFIERIVQEHSEHFKKGNKTLGTLPTDWKFELESLLERVFNESRDGNIDMNSWFTHDTFEECLESLKS